MTQYGHISVTAFISWQGRSLLVQRANDEDLFPGHCEQMGGSLDWGEDPNVGLKRETKEETGLSIEVVKPYYVYHYIDEEEDSVIEIAFICKVVGSSEVSLSPEHQEYKWITAGEVDSLQPMTDMVRGAIKRGFQETDG